MISKMSIYSYFRNDKRTGFIKEWKQLNMNIFKNWLVDQIDGEYDSF